MKLSNKYMIALVASLGLMTGVLGWELSSRAGQDMPAALRDVAMLPPLSLGDVSLLDDASKPVDRRSFTGHWSLLAFGYTHCPDICPATLSQMHMLYKVFRTQQSAEQLPQFYFVSVDPERDPLSDLGEYTRYFDTSFKAISGNIQAVTDFESQFGVEHRYEQQSGSDNYIVLHSSRVFLLDPQARIVASFQPPMDVRQVASQYTGFVQYYAGKNPS